MSESRFPYRLLLGWNQRKDGLWNADCPCGAALCGVGEYERIGAEAWHFSALGPSTPQEHARYAARHELAFAPKNAEWLNKWFELSRQVCEAMRTASDYCAGTEVAAKVLPLMDAARKELFADLVRGEKAAAYERALRNSAML